MTHPITATQALLRDIFIYAHWEGWTGNQTGRDTQLVDAEKGWELYVSNGALEKTKARHRTTHAPSQPAGDGLLRKAGERPPPGCYCTDVCMAPVIMGRQTPCRRIAVAMPAPSQHNDLADRLESAGRVSGGGVGSLMLEAAKAIRQSSQHSELADRLQAEVDKQNLDYDSVIDLNVVEEAVAALRQSPDTARRDGLEEVAKVADDRTDCPVPFCACYGCQGAPHCKLAADAHLAAALKGEQP